MERAPISVQIDSDIKTPGGEHIRVDFVNRKVARRDQQKPGKVPRYESEHAVVAESLGISVKSLNVLSEDEGYVEVAHGDPIVAATHIGDGDGHDRLVVMSFGMDPDVAAVIADQHKSRLQDEISEVSKEASINNRMTGFQVREAIRDGREGREVVIFSQAKDGRKHKETRRVKGKFAEVIPLFPNLEEEISAAA